MVRLACLYRPDDLPRIHDVWIFLIAFYCANVIVDLDHALILRRITGANQCGESFVNSEVKNASVNHLKNKPNRSMSRCAEEFLRGYRGLLDKKDLRIVERMATYVNSPIQRVQLAISPDFRHPGWKSDLLLRAKFLLGRL
jgi:hypothetical protein